MYQRKWLEVVDPKKVDLYPIQFANCDRLEENDAVFIFDEVGSGKTISSGLMALDYLEKNPAKKVLVITTNALTKGDNGGQFLNDWFSKLPFKEMGFENKVHLINNHFKNIEKNIGNYGLIIIDEAHLFIEEKTKRFEQLIKMNAHKVVLLTATPIKNSEQDLKVYITIADKILGKNNGTSFEKIKDIVSTIGKKPEQLICGVFDPKLPVTRYFKDTIQALNIDNFKKENSKRYHTLIEKYDVNYGNYQEWDELRVKALVRFINSRLKDCPDSRFVIFTRYVQKEAQYIADYLENYEDYKPFGQETEKTYAKVTGENSGDLAKYSGKTKSEHKKLPQILILSYQIAEQGVNLPGFNHIINYHVPAYPAALEQRYGRIDRLTKDGYEQIFNCFILRSGYYGTNEENFRKAVSISLQNLLKHIPSRNVVLSKQTLQNYLDISEHRKEMHDKLQQAVDNIEAVKNAFNFYIEQEKQHVNVKIIENVENEMTHLNNLELLKQETILEEANQETEMLISLLEGEERFEINSEQEELTQSEYLRELSLFKRFLSKLIELEIQDSKSEEKRRKLAEDLLDKKESIWDEIFYKKKNEDDSFESLGTINAISGCASFIKESAEFNMYKQEFINELKNTFIYNKIKQPFNEYYERMFIENKFIHLFPYIVDKTYQQQIKKAMQEDFELKNNVEENCNKDERDVILNEVDSWVEKLPVFIYFKEISLNLCRRSMTDDYQVTGSRMKYSDGNHFVKAIKYINENVFGLGEAMCEEINRFTEDDLNIKLMSNTEKTYEASNWLKIIYHCSRKEVYAKVVFKENMLIESDFPYFKKREKIKRKMLLLETMYPRLLSIKEQWNEIAGNSISSDATVLKEVIINEQLDKYYEGLVIHSKNNDIQLKKIRCYRSLFSHILFSDTGNRRAWVDYPFTRNLKIPKDGLVFVNDYWTKGILYELQAWQMSETNDVYSQYKISKCCTKPII